MRSIAFKVMPTGHSVYFGKIAEIADFTLGGVSGVLFALALMDCGACFLGCLSVAVVCV